MSRLSWIVRVVAPLLLAASASVALAQVEIKDAWVRGTVAQQKTTGAFLRITSATDARLVSVHSPAAGVVEIHEMRMDGDVMRMRAVAGIDLPANRAVELKPGGYHLMLLELVRPLKDGESVALTLTIEARDGKRSTVEVSAPVRPLGAGAPKHKH